MNNDKFMDKDGFLYFWQLLKVKLGGKVDKVDGKGLSTNDYTTAEKNKLGNIETGANKTTVINNLTSTSTSDALSAYQGKLLNDRIKSVTDDLGSLGYGDMMKATYDADNDGVVDDAHKLGGQLPSYYAPASSIPTKTSQLTNDSNFITDVSGKLDSSGNGSNVTVTFTQASTRGNIATGEKLSTIFGKIMKYFADLKTVAFTGSYTDLTNKPSIPTVTNDLTNALKSQYDTAYTHSQTAHAPSNAQANVLEGININGSAATITDKRVSITIPTAVSQLSDAAEYAKKSDLSTLYEYKGSVATYANLPTNAEVGDTYNVENDETTGGTGVNYSWNGTEWDNIGGIFSIAVITNAEIDEILAS